MNDRAENKPPEISELGCFKTPPENFKTFYDAVLELAKFRQVSISNPEPEIYNIASDLINALLQKKTRAIGRSPEMYSVLNTFHLENPGFPFLEHVDDFYFITWDFWFQAKPSHLIKSGTILTDITEPEGYGRYTRIITKTKVLWTDVHVDVNQMLVIFGAQSTSSKKQPGSKSAPVSNKAVKRRLLELIEADQPSPKQQKYYFDILSNEFPGISRERKEKINTEAKSESPNLVFPRPGRPSSSQG